MTTAHVTGICPVIETPFTVDGEVDLDSLARLIDGLLAAGVRSVMYPGFASEFYKLTDAERDAATSVVIERVHRVPGTVVVISVPDHATTVAVARACRAVELGADMVNVLPPHQHGPSAKAVRAHVREVLAAIAPTPAILQYAPAQTGTALTAQLIAQLAADAPNLAQVKVESAPPGRLISALRETAPHVGSVVGYAGVQMIDALRRGAVGVQPGSSFAEIYLRIWALWQAGATDDAARLHERLLPYISYWMQGVELIIAAEKRISQRRGLIATEVCRAPAHELDDEEEAMIDRFLAEFAEFLS